MRKRLCLVIALTVVGCAQQKWAHSSKGEQDFYRENSQCMAMAGSGQAPQIASSGNPVLQGYNQGMAVQSAANQQTIYRQCMMGNGWYLTR